VRIEFEPLEKFLHNIMYIIYTSSINNISTHPILSLPPPLPPFLPPSLFRYAHPKSGLVVKLDLQLYQIDHKNYLLDFRCVNPPLDEKDQSDSSSGADEEDSAHLRHFVMEFFEICSRLISSLAQ
jgi:hypothetical protein